MSARCTADSALSSPSADLSGPAGRSRLRRLRPRTPRRLAVELVATDADARWTVICEGKEVRVTTDPAPTQATVRGRAEQLYLWLWGRALDDRPELDGDPTAAESFRDAARV
jgi:hypothetical protein